MIRRLQNLLQPRRLHLWKIPSRRSTFVVMATTITDGEAGMDIIEQAATFKQA
jgi:hypothetical protein